MVQNGETGRGEVLTEEVLRHLSRHIKQSMPSDTKEILILLDTLFHTASSHELNIGHRIAAWNALCAVIDQSSALPGRKTAEDIIWGCKIWNRAFQLYLGQAHVTRPKSSRQLLVTLTALLSSADASVTEARTSCRASIAESMHLLIDGQDPSKVKAFASAISHFLNKEVLQLEDVLESFATLELQLPQDPLSSLLGQAFRWMAKGDFGSTIGHLVSAVLDCAHAALESTRTYSEQPVWATPLLDASRSQDIESAALRTHLLPVLFNRSVTDYLAFLDLLGLRQLGGEQAMRNPNDFSQSTWKVELLFASLQTGKEQGILQESCHPDVVLQEKEILVPLTVFGRLLSDSGRSARLTGLFCLIVSHSATRLIPVECLGLIKRNLGHLLADTNANFRGELFSLLQRLLDRLRAVTVVLARQSDKVELLNGAKHPPSRTLRHYHRFLEWLVEFLTWQLRPTASYQRHISALKCLFIILRSGIDPRVPSEKLSKMSQGQIRWSFKLDVLTADLRHTLLDLVADPFDDVRQTATCILDLFTSEHLASGNDGSLPLSQVVQNAESLMLATGRADHADGVAHLYYLLHKSTPGSDQIVTDLLDKVESMLTVAENDMQKAVESFPLHGLLTSVTYILDQDRTCALDNPGCETRIVSCLHKVWSIVKPTLCDDAPEGYLPETMEETTGVTTKDALSYCWRALKEASLLLGAVLTARQSLARDDTGVFRELSELCFTQLAELRHRGAFSTVAQTWTLCCLQTKSLKPGSSVVTLGEWLQRILRILQEKTTINTRRSAGLPSLFCGVLVADQSGQLLQESIKELEVISRAPVRMEDEQEGSLPQVHAMNCIKDILKNSRLGIQSERFLPVALQLAADALLSKAWAIRNCGLMLFRAVIDRLLGTSEAYLEDDQSSRKMLAMEDRSKLLKVMFDLLAVNPTASADSVDSLEGVFPALQLLQRVQLSGEVLTNAKSLVLRLTGSTTWHVRDKAARTYASLVPDGDTRLELRQLLAPARDSQNAAHGKLLCARYLVKRSLANEFQRVGAAKQPSPTRKALIALADDAVWIYHRSRCPVIHSAYVDLLLESRGTPSGIRDVKDAEGPHPMHDHHGIWSNTPLSIIDELWSWLNVRDGNLHFGSMPRQSLARAWAHELCLTVKHRSQADRVKDTIFDLCARDADAAVTLFETLAAIVPKTPQSSLAAIWEACNHIVGLEESLPVRVRLGGQEVLLSIMIRDEKVAKDSSVVLNLSFETRELADAAAPLLLLNMDVLLETGPIHPHIHQLEILVCETLTSAVNNIETEVPFSREALATALGQLPLTTFWHLVNTHPQTCSIRRRLALLIYDLLDDDDDEIRQLASQATSKLLNSPTVLVPQVASKNLLAHITSLLTRSDKPLDTYTQTLILTRAFGLPSSPSPTIPFCTLLSDHLNPPTTLFAHESQNLYLDLSLQSKAFAHLALNLPSPSIPSSTKSLLSDWVLQGLRALLQTSSSSNKVSINWATQNAATFLLGLQVFNGAEVLLKWVEDGERVSVKPSVVRRLLGELVGFAEGTGWNVIWREEVRRVWERGVTGYAGGVAARLEGVKVKLGVA